jgi:hypothetical protein
MGSGLRSAARAGSREASGAPAIEPEYGAMV